MDKLTCPKCNSSDLHIITEQNVFDTSLLRDDLAMAMEIKSPDMFSANCNECGSGLKLTQDGIRLAK